MNDDQPLPINETIHPHTDENLMDDDNSCPPMDSEASTQTSPKFPNKSIQIESAVMDFDQLLQAKIPERKKLIEWLPEGGLAMVAAQRGLGKTFFAVSLSACVASGKKFMKWDVKTPAGVLYIDGEMPLGDYRDRLSKFIDKKPEKPILTLNHEFFFNDHEKDLNITDGIIQKKILEYLDHNPEIKLVALDNLSSLAMIPEDKSDDWRELFRPFLINCRKRRVAVLIIHHTNKAGHQRGTGAREDHLDTSILLKSVGEDQNDGAHFKVEFTKSRGVYGDAIEPFSAKLMENSEGMFEWILGDANAKVKDRLLKLIRDYGSEGVTVKEAAEELCVTPGAISKGKSALIDEEKIQPGKRMILK